MSRAFLEACVRTHVGNCLGLLRTICSSCSESSCVAFFFSSRRRHTRYWRDWSSDVCSSDLGVDDPPPAVGGPLDVRMPSLLLGARRPVCTSPPPGVVLNWTCGRCGGPCRLPNVIVPRPAACRRDAGRPRAPDDDHRQDVPRRRRQGPPPLWPPP